MKRPLPPEAACQLEALRAHIDRAKGDIANCRDRINDILSDPRNNVFDDLEFAEGYIEGELLDKAHNDCEGSYNVGADEYTQLFMVGAQTYKAILRCEYNRHDKTYYYVDGSTFECVEVTA